MIGPRRLVAVLAVLTLSACPTRELYLQASEVAWERQGIQRLAVPAFQAEPRAWGVAEEARRAIATALDRGTVDVTERSPQATLEGAVVDFREASNPGPPRRVQRATGSTGLATNAFYWEMDVTHQVELKLAVRLVDQRGEVLWTRQTFGNASETQAMPMNWPGNDPVPPPALMPYPAEPEVFTRLRERALAQALQPMLDALAVRYRFRPVN